MYKAPIRPKALLVMEECNPTWASVPLVGYRFFDSISKTADVTLVTHARNREGLEPVRNGRAIVYIRESTVASRYFKVVEKIANRGNMIWPLFHALRYPIYVEFNRAVYDLFEDSVRAGKFDVVHAMTPILPRFPVKLSGACTNTPFLLGPVNGGLPFPRGFQDIEKKESAHFNALRALVRFLPGYRATYKKADRILAGSGYTRGMLASLFPGKRDVMSLFAENGIPDTFFSTPRTAPPQGPIKLLFVGRLVPYKGADMLIEALARLPLVDFELTIIGDGPERTRLQELARGWELEDRITFTGWIPQEETARHYKNADLFCFPSIREFGGAVVLEAMAAGLPCIVPDHGGIGEYVTPSSGFKVAPTSRKAVIQGMADAIDTMARTPQLWTRLSRGAVDRAREFLWDSKGEQIVRIYRELIEQKRSAAGK